MLGDQRHKAVVGSKLIEDIVGDEKHLLLKILDVRMAQQIRIGCLEYLACLVRNQMISNIVFIFEIKIESALCNAGVVPMSEIEVLLKPLSIKSEKAESRRDSRFICLLLSIFPTESLLS